MTTDYEPQLARQFKLDINTGTDATPVWTHVGGITNMSPSADAQMTDDSDFDASGRARSSVTERSNTFQVDMNYLEDTTTGDRDPGQQAIIDACNQIGAAAKKTYRYSYPNGTDAVTFRANATLNLPGGGKNDNASLSCTLTVDGAITNVTLP